MGITRPSGALGDDPELEAAPRPVPGVHPVCKVLGLIVACAIAFTLPSPPALLALLATLWLAALVARADLPALARVMRLSLPFCAALLMLQVVTRREGPVVLALGPLAVHAAAAQAAALSLLRVQCLAVACAQFWLWTHPLELALLLAQAGVPYRYAFLPTLAFRALPLLQHELGRVVEGQELCGIEMGGNLRKVLHLPRLFIPFCLSTLRVANDMALALELRGFGAAPQRTYRHTLRWRRRDLLLTAAILAAGALCVALAGPPG